MNIFKKAINKASDFLKAVKKETIKQKRQFVKSFKRKYTYVKTADSFEPGNLLSFNYNALHKEHRYDKAPFIVSLGYAKPRGKVKPKKYIYGLNLHHLREQDRVKLASLIVEMLNKKNDKLEYEDIKPLLRKFEGSPILRMYVIRRISQRVIKMPKDVYLRASTFTYGDFTSA